MRCYIHSLREAREEKREKKREKLRVDPRSDVVEGILVGMGFSLPAAPRRWLTRRAVFPPPAFSGTGDRTGCRPYTAPYDVVPEHLGQCFRIGEQVDLLVFGQAVKGGISG
jgi:hypothetical protein